MRVYDAGATSEAVRASCSQRGPSGSSRAAAGSDDDKGGQEDEAEDSHA
jgi:hypothetical protein